MEYTIQETLFPPIEFEPVYFVEVATGNIYQGAMQPGDRVATPEDIAAHTEAIPKQNQRNLILAQLDEIDRKSIRALRCGETDRLVELETQAAELRAQLL